MRVDGLDFVPQARDPRRNGTIDSRMSVARFGVLGSTPLPGTMRPLCPTSGQRGGGMLMILGNFSREGGLIRLIQLASKGGCRIESS